MNWNLEQYENGTNKFVYDIFRIYYQMQTKSTIDIRYTLFINITDSADLTSSIKDCYWRWQIF